MRLAILVLSFAVLAGGALADGLVLKDAERFDPRYERRMESRVVGRVYRYAPPLLGPPPTCCTGYVGSAYGLGKPNYYGISPRPDDGYLH